MPRSKIFHPHERQKLLHAGAPLLLSFLIGKLQDFASSRSKVIEILILLNFCIDLVKYLTRSKLFHPHETGSCRSSIPSFLNWEITKAHEFRVKINWNIDFVKMLKWIISSKNKNIGNIWQELSSFIHMKERNWFMQEPLQSFLS